MGVRTDTRQRMVTNAALMLRERGVAGTSIAGVLERSHGPRGSVGHHFPGGRTELLSDALRSAGDAIATRLRQAAGSGASPVQVYSAIVQHYRSALADSAFRSGCPVWAAAQEAYADPALGQVVTEILDEWTTLLCQVLVRAGHEPVASRRVALLCISALEGAITMSRVQRSVEPIDLTHTMMLPLLADPTHLNRDTERADW